MSDPLPFAQLRVTSGEPCEFGMWRAEVLVDGQPVATLPCTRVGWDRTAATLGHLTITVISEDAEVRSRNPKFLGEKPR